MIPFYGHPNTTMMQNQVNYLQGANYETFYGNQSLNSAVQAYQQFPNDPLINYGVQMVHSISGYSPGGVSGYGTYVEPVANQYVSFADQYLIPNGIDTLNQVSNTQYYSSNAFNEYTNYWDSRTPYLGSISATNGSLGYTLDSAVPGMSQLMDQSTGPLANYSATSSEMYSLFNDLGMGGFV